MAAAGGGGLPSADNFVANAACLRELQSMGFDQETAAQALFFTGNNSSDAAVTWIFDNQGQSPQVAAAFGPAGGWESEPANLEGEEHTMVIVINTSLGMTPGKIAAQAAHAAVAGYRHCTENRALTPSLNQWEQDGERTIVVGGDNAPHLEALERRASDRGLVSLLTSDAGRTQVAHGSKTALCIFGEKSKVDAITGNLRPL